MASQVSAWTHGKVVGATGFAQLGASSGVGPSYAFLNAMQNWGMTVTSGACASVSICPPALINNDGYPIGPTIPADILGVINFETGDSGYLGQWQISWTGTGAFRLPYNNTQLTLNAGCTGGTTCTQSTSTTFSGVNSSITFTLAGTHTGIGSVNTGFPTGFTYSGMTNLRFCKVGNATPDDCTRLANGEVINPAFSNSITPINPRTIRLVNWSGAVIADRMYPFKRSYSAGPNSIGWLNAHWSGPSIWAGSTTDSGTDTFVSPTFPDAPASWPSFSATSSVVMWQTLFATTNSTTTPTVSVTGISGAKIIVSTKGEALAASDIKTDRPATLAYDPVIDRVVYAPNGIAAVVPIEAQVALANKLNSNLWFNFGGMVDDASVTSYVAYANANLNPALKLYTEYMNEVWNFSLGNMTNWVQARGAALGFTNANNERVYGPHGFRTYQINVLAAAAWSRAATDLKRVLANQSSPPAATAQQKYRMEGFDLNSTNFPTYGTFTGGVNHDTSPNRPIDNSEVISYATYYTGAILTWPTGNFGGTYAAGDLADCTVAGTNSGGLLCAANNYTLGTGPSLAAAWAWIENDLRQGTKNGGQVSATLLCLAAKVGTAPCNAIASGATYATWEAIAAKAGYPAGIAVEAYEGGWQAAWPDSSNCTSMGLTTLPGGFANAATCTATLQAMLTAFKFTSNAYGIALNQFQQFMGTDATAATFGLLPHSKTPAWYEYEGPVTSANPWALIPNSPYNTPYFQFYNAFGDFRGWLLKRDIDPASNDNDPMWLEKAA